jgi:hypothetical protein
MCPRARISNMSSGFARVFEIDPLVVLIFEYLELKCLSMMFSVSCDCKKVKELSAIWEFKFYQQVEPRVILPSTKVQNVSPSEWTHYYSRLRRWKKRHFNWHVIEHEGDAFPFTYLHRAALIPTSDCAYMFGGVHGDRRLDSLWRVKLKDSADAICPQLSIHKVEVSPDTDTVPTARAAGSMVCIDEVRAVYTGGDKCVFVC